MMRSRLGIFVVFVLPAVVLAHESPIDHINRTLTFDVQAKHLRLGYRMNLTPRVAILQLRKMDRNRDGNISDNEQSGYFEAFARRLSSELVFEMNEKRLPVRVTDDVKLYPDLSNEYHFSVSLGCLMTGRHVIRFRDEFSRRYPGSVRLAAAAPRAGDSVVEIRKDVRRSQRHLDMIEVDLEITVLEN
tara:strand:- start:1428 stop:1991 length:564 start_codon:yes stop_codon:yes gene_type:complete